MRHLLIDADIIAYMASAANQKTWDWGDGVVTTKADEDAAKRQARDVIDRFMADLDAHKLTVCLSDDFENFRKDFFPSYKGNRRGVDRPVHLYDIKAYLAEAYPSASRARLEADDVMGIMATEPGTGEDRIMVSADKDMKTVPGLLYRPQECRAVLEITREAADRFHLFQTVTGDPTDGYPGCPGAGKVAAERAVDACVGVKRVEHMVARGPSRGELSEKWVQHTHETPWDAVVSLYAKAGLNESAAVTQARCARILRHGEYDRRPILWKPR